jgi:hypothetical protein
VQEAQSYLDSTITLPRSLRNEFSRVDTFCERLTVTPTPCNSAPDAPADIHCNNHFNAQKIILVTLKSHSEAILYISFDFQPTHIFDLPPEFEIKKQIIQEETHAITAFMSAI